MIEGYIDFSIMTALSINALYSYRNLNFWGTKWDALCSFGTIITAIFLICYPTYSAIAIYKNLDYLDSPYVIKKLGILYKD